MFGFTGNFISCPFWMVEAVVLTVTYHSSLSSSFSVGMAFSLTKSRFLKSNLSCDKINANYKQYNNYNESSNKEYILP